MQQFAEFVGNHALLSGAFVAVLLLLAWTEVTRRGQGFKRLSPAQAVEFLNRGQVAVVDVSAPADFGKGHIVGARNLPVSRLSEADKEVERLLQNPVLVTCKSGTTSDQAAAALVKRGASEVAVLKGGMTQWLADHYPVTRH